jgi:hypothetical protein
MSRDPVVLAKIGAHQNAEAFEDFVAHAVPVFLVDRREMIDVEQNQRKRIAEARRALDLLPQRRVEDGP